MWIHAVILGSTHEHWERVRQHVSADDILLLHPVTSILEGYILTWSVRSTQGSFFSLPGKEGCDGCGMHLSLNLSLKIVSESSAYSFVRCDGGKAAEFREAMACRFLRSLSLQAEHSIRFLCLLSVSVKVACWNVYQDQRRLNCTSRTRELSTGVLPLCSRSHILILVLLALTVDLIQPKVNLRRKTQPRDFLDQIGQ